MIINWQIPNIILCTVTALLVIGLAVRAWSFRPMPGATEFTLLMASIAWVLGSYALEAAAGADLNTYVTLIKFEYIGLSFIPLFWLAFAVRYSGREWRISRAGFAALALIPIITIALAITNDWHGLIWAVPRFDTSVLPAIYTPDYGAGFWAYSVYAYIIYLIASIILMRRAYDSWLLYRSQALLIFAGSSMPWIANLFEIFNITPVPGLYVNVFFIAGAVICLAIAVLRLRMLDVMPVAYDTILNTIPDGVIVLDSRDRVVAVNQAAAPILTRPSGSVIGQPITDALADYCTSMTAIMSATTDLPAEGRIYPIRSRQYEIRHTPLTNAHGDQRGRVLIFTEATARLQGERERAALYEETRRYAMQLEMLYYRVSHLERLKSDMIRIAAHDLRDPIHLIMGFLELFPIKVPNLPPEAADILARIDAATQRMHGIVSEFLSLDRIQQLSEDSGQTFDLAAVTERAAADYQPRAALKGQTLTLTLTPTPCPIVADEAQIYEAIVNLIGNAIKYTPDHGTIQVTLTPLIDDRSARVRLEVIDSGIGIPDDAHDRLFTPFFRVKTPETTAIEGTGLGLFLVKSIIERSGGRMLFTSVYGQGSMFGFELPTKVSSPTETATAPAQPPSNRATDEQPTLTAPPSLAVTQR